MIVVPYEKPHRAIEASMIRRERRSPFHLLLEQTLAPEERHVYRIAIRPTPALQRSAMCVENLG